MIYKPGTRIPTNAIYAIYDNALRVLTAIYKGARLIWQSGRSCFGMGYWDNEKPWLNDDGWKNNV